MMYGYGYRKKSISHHSWFQSPVSFFSPSFEQNGGNAVMAGKCKKQAALCKAGRKAVTLQPNFK